MRGQLQSSTLKVAILYSTEGRRQMSNLPHLQIHIGVCAEIMCENLGSRDSKIWCYDHVRHDTDSPKYTRTCQNWCLVRITASQVRILSN